MTARVLLPVQEPSGVARRAWPVTQGVPFAEGTLPLGTPMRVLDPDGNPLPTQTHCLATWREDRRDVKWLLVDFQADLAPHEQKTYTLEFGPHTEPPPPSEPVRVTATAGVVTIDTGPLAFTLQRDVADFFRSLSLRVNGVTHDLLRDGGTLGLVMRDAHGNDYDSRFGSLPPCIEVEEAGPLRACVRVSGYHTSDAGLRFCPYILRIHAYAGSGHLRVDHTYVFDQEPEDVRLAAVQLYLPLTLDGERTLVCGGTSVVHGKDTLRLVQSGDRVCRAISGAKTLAAWERASAWAAQRGRDIAAVAVIRDMWQQHPKAIALDDHAITFEIWPGDAPPLDYTNPFGRKSLWLRGNDVFDDDKLTAMLAEHPDAPLDLHFTALGNGPEAIRRCHDLKHRLDRFAPNRPFAFSNTDIARATGTAKTTELHLLFHDAPRSNDSDTTDAACDAFARAVNEPLLALPPAGYVAATGATRHLHPRDPARFPDAEQALEAIFDKLVLEPQEKLAIFGHINYGEMVNGHTVNTPVAYRAVRDDPSQWPDVLEAMGLFNNESQDAINGLWAYYLRTGDRKYFRFAEAKSRHTEDVDFVHEYPRFAQVYPWPNTPDKAIGQMHYHSVNNWSGPYVPSHSLVSGILRHYFLTGERRALDVARGLTDNLLRNQTNDGIISANGLNREFTGPLCSAIEVYQITWEKPLLHLIRNSLDALRTCINATGNLPHKINTGRGPHRNQIECTGLDNRTGYPGGMLCHVAFDAWRLFAEPWMRDWIVQLAGSWVHGIRADDIIPASQVASENTNEDTFTVRKLPGGWYWHSFASYASFCFDPLIALAWRLTGEDRFLGYLHHRARMFPDMGRDAADCLTGHAFNAVNHCGDAVPAILSALAEAGPERCDQAYQIWKRQRADAGFPVCDFSVRYNPDGSTPGEAVRITPREPTA